MSLCPPYDTCGSSSSVARVIQDHGMVLELMDFLWNRSDGTHEALLRKLVASARQLRVICPYIRQDALDSLAGMPGLRRLAEVKFLTLWSLADFLRGSSALAGLDLLLCAGAEVRVLRSELHAKVYIFDESDAVVTSANLTQAGLERNLECGVHLSGDPVAAVVSQFRREWRFGQPIGRDDLTAASAEVERRQDEFAKIQEDVAAIEEAMAERLLIVSTSRASYTDDLVVNLTKSQEELLMRPVRGQGGYQSLLRKLQGNISGGRLSLSPQDCERIVRYAGDYGGGGWQGRLRSIADAARRYVE